MNDGGVGQTRGVGTDKGGLVRMKGLGRSREG